MRVIFSNQQKGMADKMKKKILSMCLATLMCGTILTSCSDDNKNDITVLVPNADHGWTGAVMSLAEEKVAELTKDGKYKINVVSSTDAQNQISQLEDIIENGSTKSVVILPQDNQLEASMKKLAGTDIDFVMFDRIIDSVSDKAVSNVKGDNHGIGAETAKRFIANGLKPGDKILVMPGDNSTVPQMRNDGFQEVLKENGWTDEQISAIESTDYTGWSRSKGKELFTSWMDSKTVDEIASYKFIFTHDDEISMGILEALKGSDIDDVKKEAFYSAGVNLSSSSGLNEMYSVLAGKHQKDYTDITSKLADIFSVTYDPAMIQTAIQSMVDKLEEKSVDKENVVPVSVVDSENVADFKGFGDAVSK